MPLHKTKQICSALHFLVFLNCAYGIFCKNPAYQIFAFSAEVACSCWMHVERKHFEIRSPLPKLNHKRIFLNFRVHSIISTTLETLLYTGFNERLARGFNLLIRTDTTAHMMQKMPNVKIK